MKIGRFLAALAGAFLVAGAAWGAPGDIVFDTSADDPGELGRAVLEGDSDGSYIVVLYVNMDAVDGFSAGDTIVRMRYVGLRKFKDRPAGVEIVTPVGFPTLTVR